MNNKLLLQDLTDLLAEVGKIKKKDAEEFLRAFFKIAEDALFEDGIIKISGLGTLKLILVDARKSVNVSTGEEFEIREHYKISFIPDAELKNLVNQPYAHLDPVELDGGSQNNSLSNEKKTVTINGTTTKKVGSNKDNTKEEKAVRPESPQSSKRKTYAWILFFLLIALLGVWSWISNDQRKKEDIVKIREIEMIDSLEAKITIKEDMAAMAKDTTSDSTAILSPDDALEATIKLVAQETGLAKTSIKTIPTETKPAKTVAKLTKPVVKSSESVAKQATPVIKTTKPVVKSTKTETKPTTPPVQKRTPPAPQEYIATVVLTPGNRLTLLSLKYYGDKAFWVYIYQANKNVIQNPDNIPAGTTLRIPKPDPKLIDAKNQALIAKAKALQLQFLEKK